MIRIILVLSFLFFHPKDIFALDWIKLHEEADNKNFAEAEKEVESNPSSIEAKYILGLVCLNLHKDNKAEIIFSDILQRYPDSKEAKWGLAEVLRRQHRLAKAEKILKAIIKENPDFSPAYITLAYIKYFQLDFNEAVRLAYEVIRRGRDKTDLSNFTRAYAMYAGAKGMLAHYGGPLSKAVNGLAVKVNLNKAEALQPNSAAILFGLGSYYLLAPKIAGGDRKKAQEYLEKAIEQDPLFLDAYVRLAQLYRLNGDNLRYQLYLNKVSELDPQNELFLDYKSASCRFICPEKEPKEK